MNEISNTTPPKPQPPKTHPQRTQSTLMAGAGAAFLALAAFFLWRDLALPRELVMLGAALVTGAAAVLRRPLRWPAAAPTALLATVLAAGGWFWDERAPGLLPALWVTLVAAAVATLRLEWPARRGVSPVSTVLTYYALGAAFLAASGASYFQYLAAGDDVSVARRLVLTVVWLAVGLALFLASRGRAAALWHVGLGLVVLAASKALVYDTTHLHGSLRVLVLAATGGLLLLAARALRARAPAPMESDVAVAPPEGA